MTPQLLIFLLLYLFTEGFEYVLELLNLLHLRKNGATIPAEFAGKLDSAQLERTRDYTLTSTRFGMMESLFSSIVMLFFIFSGMLRWYSDWIGDLYSGPIIGGVLFFLLLSLGKNLLDLPWELYEKFGIERRFGFNRTTVKTWLTDQLKSVVTGLLLTALLTAGALALVTWLPNWWWLAVWFFFLIFSVFMMYLAPYVLEPLFNKFTAIENPELEERIKTTVEKAGIKVKGVYQMDASRRTNHTNAYFSGIGKVKRIVLYDTLLEKLDHDEIIAVLAHEAGHCRRRHIIKLMVIFELGALVGSYLAYLALKSGFPEWLFGLGTLSFPARILLLFFAAGVVSWLTTPLFNLISRRFEYEADGFARELTGDGNALERALIKLSTDNLSNLHPHPLYACWHYSHPPVLARIHALKASKSGSA